MVYEACLCDVTDFFPIWFAVKTYGGVYKGVQNTNCIHLASLYFTFLLLSSH